MSDRKKNDSGTSQFNFKKSNYQKFDLNNLPKGWINVPMSQIACLINGRAFKPENWSSEGLPIVRIQNLNDHTKPFNYCNFEVDKKFCIDDGQILFAWSGTPKTSFGCFIWNRGKAILNQHIFRVEIDEKYLNKQFICYAINQNLDKYISKAHGGVGLRHITKGKFEEESVFLPPFNEQKRIVAKIESIFSRIDAAREKLDLLASRVGSTSGSLDTLRDSVLKQAFEGRLVPQDPGDESAQILLERISKNLNRKLIFEKNNNLPQGHILCPIDSIGNVITGTTPSKKKMVFYGGKIPFYKPGDLNNGYYVKDSREKLSRDGLAKARLIPEKSILITSIGATIGKTGFNRIAGTTNQQINSIVPFKNCLVSEFLYFVCISPQFQKLILDGCSATTLPILNKSKFKKLLIPVPPLNEQKRIVAKIESIFGRIDLVLTCVRHNVRIFRLHFYSFLICSIV